LTRGIEGHLGLSQLANIEATKQRAEIRKVEVRRTSGD
jgi:hypothetical protein